MRFLFIFLIVVTLFSSCKEKDLFSVRLPKNQTDLITKEKINYNRGVQLRYSKDKTIFFSSIENMLKYVKKYDWNLLKAGVKKAYITDYYKSKDKKTEMWINLNVAFFAYIKNSNGNKILIAFNNPKILMKHKNEILPLNWKYTKPMKSKYFTFIELIRELRASKKAKRGKK